MTAKKITIGFDRYIERQWLDKTAAWVVQGATRNELGEKLDPYLGTQIQGQASLKNTKAILNSIWLNNSASDSFMAQGKELYRAGDKHERLAVHWGLTCARYPFFISLNRLLGRLFRVQEDIHSRELMRRSIELHGDTDSVRRATLRLLQSLAQWQVLKSDEQSIFHPKSKIPLHNTALLTWLMSALFYSTDRQRYSVEELLSDPVWFPFEVSYAYFDINRSGLLEVVHRGVGDTLVALAGG